MGAILPKRKYLSGFLEVCSEVQECRDPRGVLYPPGLLVFGLTLSECAGMFTQRGKEIWLEAHWKWIVRLWLKKSDRRPFSKGTPSQSCICRFLRALNPKYLGDLLSKLERKSLSAEWDIFLENQKSQIRKRKLKNTNKKGKLKSTKETPAIARKIIPQYCLDGKSRKGCVSIKTGRTEIDLTLYCTDTQQILATRTLKDKEGEQKGSLTILRKEAKTLQRGVISGDAGILSPKVTKLTKKSGHSYIFSIKGNAGNVFKEIKKYDWEAIPELYEYQDTPAHGREELRVIKKSTIAAIGADNFDKYDSAAMVYEVTSYVHHIKKDKRTKHARYFLGDKKISRWSLPTILAYIRGHWGLETYHFTKDVVLKEDDCQIKSNNGSRILGILRSSVVKASKILYPSTQNFLNVFKSKPEKTAKMLDMT